MKIKYLALVCMLLLLSGCAGNAAIETPQNTPVPTQSAENISVGIESEKRATGGVKLTMVIDEAEENGKEKTVSYYMFEGEKLISIKTEETYKTEEQAKNSHDLLVTKPESCVDVMQNGKTVTYYASVSAMEFMQDMKKEDIKTLGTDIGAEVEEF